MKRVLVLILSTTLLTGCSLIENFVSFGNKEEPAEVEETKKPEKKEKKILAELVSEDFEAGSNWAIARGTIKNTGEEPVEIDKVSAAAYDQEGKVVGAASGLVFPPVLFPNQESSAGIFINETGREKWQIKEVKIRFSFGKTKKRITALQVINFTGKSGEATPYIITGEIKNHLPQKVEEVKVVLMFYDTEEKLVNIVEAALEPDFILPGETAPFKKACTTQDVWIALSEKFRALAYTPTQISPPTPMEPVIRVEE